MYHIGRFVRGCYDNTRQCRFVRFLTGAAPLPLTDSAIKMKAWQIHSYGEIKELHLEPSRVPLIAESDQVLIKVKATSLNPIDLMMLGGYGKSLIGLMRWYEAELPLVLGREFAGTIVDKGRGVSDTEFNIGDDVYGIIPVQKQGCQSEYVVASKAHVLLRPSHLSVIEAASILYASITAWSALFVSGELAIRDPAKTSVLIIGASGGVGTVATQLLKSQNITVVGVCAADAVPLVTSLGADHVHDYRDPEYKHKVAAHGIYDIILDCAKYGHENIPGEWKYKRFVTLNSPLLDNTDKFGFALGGALSAGAIISANLPGIFSGKTVRWGFFSPQPAAFDLIDELVKNKQLHPIIQKVFKFNETPEAFTMLASGHLRGKIVIDLQETN